MSIRDNLIETRYHYDFIHNVFSFFYNDSLEYFSSYLQPRFNTTIISTYDKAVQYLKQKNELNREMDKPNLPAIILDPGELNISENGGMQFWRFPNHAPGLIKRLFYPIYQDNNLLITCGFSRFKGDFTLTAFINSVYEFLDLKALYLQIFGGINRIIYPTVFSSFIIIPDELYNYEYNNNYTGVSYKINWEGAGSESKLIKTTNRTEHVFPVNIRPRFRLLSMSDNSTKMGGTDNLSDWILSTNIEFEVEIPSFIVLESDYLVENIKLKINSGSTFSLHSTPPPIRRNITLVSLDWNLNEDEDSELDTDATSEIVYSKEIVFKTRYYHLITQDDIDSTSYVDISIPETITDHQYLLVNYRYGLLDYNDHYNLIDNGNILRIKIDKVELVKNTAIELYIYTDSDKTS